ncbi:hypothetical protein AKJ09_10962 [Labilithrix luteola]|uniref:Uncharacterized protein n=1 Tax=Labilithrix luteola TaxID=1391654 RepID=A0A0K1QEW2_9BACT|nr:hypothetical protein AKJ09_10962 [Labilithrix luteola]
MPGADGTGAIREVVALRQPLRARPRVGVGGRLVKVDVPNGTPPLEAITHDMIGRTENGAGVGKAHGNPLILRRLVLLNHEGVRQRHLHLIFVIERAAWLVRRRSHREGSGGNATPPVAAVRSDGLVRRRPIRQIRRTRQQHEGDECTRRSARESHRDRGLWVEGADEPEAHSRNRHRSRIFAATRRCHRRGVRVARSTASTDDATSWGVYSGVGIGERSPSVAEAIERVVAPLRGIAEDVVQAPAIRLFQANRVHHTLPRLLAARIEAVPSDAVERFVQVARARRIVGRRADRPRVRRRRRASARRVLPLGLHRKAIALTLVQRTFPARHRRTLEIVRARPITVPPTGHASATVELVALGQSLRARSRIGIGDRLVEVDVADRTSLIEAIAHGTIGRRNGAGIGKTDRSPLGLRCFVLLNHERMGDRDLYLVLVVESSLRLISRRSHGEGSGRNATPPITTVRLDNACLRLADPRVGGTRQQEGGHECALQCARVRHSSFTPNATPLAVNLIQRLFGASLAASRAERHGTAEPS